MKFMFGMFILTQLGDSSNMNVNKREAKCTLIVRHLFRFCLFAQSINCKYLF